MTAITLAATLTASLGVAAVATTQPASAADSAVVEVPSYAMGIPGRTWEIQKPSLCGAEIGAGGNLFENGRTYDGRCQGAGQVPTITGTAEAPALTFRTKHDFRYPGAILENAEMNTWVGSDGKRLRDRTELATTRGTLPFNTNVWVGFDIRIPAGVDDVTGSGAYVMQLWQCNANPIGGVRIQSGAGNGHNLQFTRRGDDPTVSDTYYNTSMATQSIGTDEWHSFVIKYHVTPYSAGGAKGLIEVWHRRVGATTVETKILEQEDYFGYRPNTTCDDGEDIYYDDSFRIKYGMYKDYQPGATFRADYRNVRIGASKAEVQPYYRD
ncbi:heparin lyase I family protein [Promicromonospora sp. Populi]|uniref:heparin lyase I family protein n=1 Tax=Promicromonospora sp. Populi TaxID=3239420 RepID=UPI0034E1E2EA